MTTSSSGFGTFIRDRRQDLGLTQISLAKMAGLNQVRISSLETGKRKRLSTKQVEKLSEALRIDAAELRKLMPARPCTHSETALGKLVRSRREEIGLSCTQLADRMGTSLGTISALENGKRSKIHPATARKLSAALEIDLSNFTPFTRSSQAEGTNEFGRIIRSRRKELGLSMAELGKSVGASKQFVSYVELGSVSLSNSDKMIAKFAQALGLDIDSLKNIRPPRRQKRDETHDPLAEIFAARRLELGQTQQEVAKRTGLSLSTVHRIEKEASHSNLRTIEKVAEALGCRVSITLTPLPQIS